jgi:hypothetical protein
MSYPPVDTPELRKRVVRLLLLLSPGMFVLSYVLAAVQGADTRVCLIVAAAGFVMCLCFAALYWLRGPKWLDGLNWINILRR